MAPVWLFKVCDRFYLLLSPVSTWVCFGFSSFHIFLIPSSSIHDTQLGWSADVSVCFLSR
jgi:hypothetical protein